MLIQPPQKPPVFKKSLAGVALIFFLGAKLFYSGYKGKDKLDKVAGPIVSLEKKETGGPLDKGKLYEFIRVADYSQVFQIALSDDKSFTDKYPQRFDQLAVGDEITVYFDEVSETNPEVNNSVDFIDKNGQSIYVKKSADKEGGLAFMGIALLILGGLYVLKRKGKIA